MPMQPVEVITPVERRRRWSRAEKERLVAASLAPGVSVSEVARAAGLHVRLAMFEALAFLFAVLRAE